MKLSDALNSILFTKPVNGVVVELHSRKVAYEMTDVTRSNYNVAKLNAELFKLDSTKISISFCSSKTDFLIVTDLQNNKTRFMNVVSCGPFGESEIFILCFEGSAQLTETQMKNLMTRIERKESVLNQFLESCEGAEFIVVYTE